MDRLKSFFLREFNMLLPYREISHQMGGAEFRVEVQGSLEYQMKKTLYVCHELELLLDKESESNFHYNTNERVDYFFDFLVGNFSILMEYYYTWVVFCGIGTNKIKKIQFKTLGDKEKLDDRILRVFNEFEIGVIESKKDQDYFEKCSAFFKESTSFLFCDSFNEIFVLNNFIKHNRVMMGYAPKFAIVKNGSEEMLSFPYVNISSFFGSKELFNRSVYKELVSFGLDDNRKIKNPEIDSFYANLFNKEAVFLGEASNKMCFFDFDGMELFVSGLYVGISVESVISLTHNFCKNIVEIMRKSISDNSSALELYRLVDENTKRKPRTLKNALLI